jgi:prevent-host-death family protein
MKKHNPEPQQISVTDAREDFHQLMHEIVTQSARVVIGRRGEPQVIVMSLDDYKHNIEEGLLARPPSNRGFQVKHKSPPKHRQPPDPALVQIWRRRWKGKNGQEIAEEIRRRAWR